MMKTEKRLRRKCKRWTAQEEAYLERHIEVLPALVIAERLGRTRPSIEKKAARMGYRIIPILDYVSARFLSINSGIATSTLSLWLSQGLIEAKKESGKWAIKISNFKHFVHKHPKKAEKINPDFLSWLDSK